MTDGGPFHVFVDESIRPDGLYRLTAVRVPTRDLAAIARLMRERVPPGQTRTHLSAESDQRRRIILRAYVSLGKGATVYQAPYDRRTDDQPARDRCLRSLVRDVATSNVVALVLDTRGPRRDRLDRITLRAALHAADREAVAYSHRGSRDELLLGLPDAIGWAVGAGRPWAAMVAPIVSVRNLRELG